MFREMRRIKQLLPIKDTLDILKSCNSGVLGLCSDNNYPYTVPLNYVLKDNKVYFHSAKMGHKIEAIKKNNKVSFTVVQRDDVVEELFSTIYRSATVFGKAKILTSEKEKREVLALLVQKYSPLFINESKKRIDGSIKHLAIIEVIIEHMTGKVSSI